MEKLLNTLMSGKVQRYHATPTVPCQGLAEHQWNVAVIAYHLATAGGYDEDVAQNIAMLALFHDTPELITGDIPAPVKWDQPEMEVILRHMEKEAAKTLYTVEELRYSTVEKAIMKVADSMEGFHWCCEMETGGLIKSRWEDHLLRAWESHRFHGSIFTDNFIDEWEAVMIAFGVCQDKLSVLYEAHKMDGAHPSPAYVNQG